MVSSTDRAEAAGLLYSQARLELQFLNKCSGDFFITALCELAPPVIPLRKTDSGGEQVHLSVV